MWGVEKKIASRAGGKDGVNQAGREGGSASKWSPRKANALACFWEVRSLSFASKCRVFAVLWWISATRPRVFAAVLKVFSVVVAMHFSLCGFVDRVTRH